MSEPDSRDGERSETLNQSLKALSCPARRRILLALESQHPREVGEFQSEEFRPAETEPAFFTIRLHHEHLPHLDEAGFIIWNRAADTIMKGPDFEELQPLMRCIQNQFDVDFDG
ncbi:ArsR family transcriptional regulator [Haloterrigena sp. H1]|uniref:ArsR family transcriptional regulator n=1 Tax=Haloterrigena sp. H1 TaxID=2552943 RepID=UPI00110EA103|nr:ArsR family transcriptional regulator [Haloterrigena sp. H1]TMT81417.1 ArsR family transcriptional regulator [Haloterrigena sp. H1]